MEKLINNSLLPSSFYLDHDVVKIAKKLLGKYVFTYSNNQLTGGMIVETEAYSGTDDKACHAYKGIPTKRTEPMFENGGIAYVYLCYGMHFLLNVVTNKKNIPHAVLIRAIEPKIGLDIMLKRRNKKIIDRTLTAGPGALSQALNITKKDNYKSFLSSSIWIEDKNIIINDEDIISSKRIGVSYAKEDALLPWRFRIKNNNWTSFPK